MANIKNFNGRLQVSELSPREISGIPGKTFWDQKMKILAKNDSVGLAANLDGYLPDVNVGSRADAVEFLGEGLDKSCGLSDRGAPRLGADAVDGLGAAIKKFRQLGAQSGVDHDFAALVSDFKLPDPSKRPAFYRVIQKPEPGHPQLAILWGGIADGADDNVPPEEALEMLRRVADGKYRRTGINAATALVLAALGCTVIVLLLWVIAHAGNPVTGEGKALNTPSPPTVKRLQLFSLSPLTVLPGQAVVMESAVRGLATLPGDQTEHLPAGKKVTKDIFLKPGRYRIDWYPSAPSKTIHGEYLFLYVVDETTVGGKHIGGGGVVPLHPSVQASLSLVPRQVAVGGEATAHTGASYVPAGKIIKRKIQWSAGKPFIEFEGTTLTHRFRSKGVHIVTLVVTSSDGRHSTTRRREAVGVPPLPLAPISAILLGRSNQADRTVTVRNAAVRSPGSANSPSEVVNWGDGSKPTTLVRPGATYTHHYKLPGTYHIKATAFCGKHRSLTPATASVNLLPHVEVRSTRGKAFDGKDQITLYLIEPGHPNHPNFKVLGWRLLPQRRWRVSDHRSFTVTKPPGKYTAEVHVSFPGTKASYTYSVTVHATLNESTKYSGGVTVGKTQIVK